MSASITIHRATPSDIPVLLPLAKAIFDATYAHLNRPENVAEYLAKAFSEEQFRNEVSQPDSRFYMAFLGESPVGYTKLNFSAAQTELKDERAVEIERIYVFQGYQGQGVGRQLIRHACQVALSHQLDYIWLGVWERNPAAIAFYHRMGFRPFGQHIFQFGNEAQTDVMMRLEVAV